MLPEKRIAAFIVSLALFMDALDATIINTAIPAISESLNINPIDLKIALISYLLSLAIFIPISGWVGDKFGVQRVFISALGVFTLSSFACGHADSLLQLIGGRSLQGVGGAFMLPLGRLIVLRTFPRHEVFAAMNTVVMVVSLGLMLGPFAGGVITDQLSWHWIFWVNIPVGIFAMAVSAYWLKPIPSKKPPKMDLVGFILFGGGLAGLTFSFSALSESKVAHTTVFIILLIAILMLVAYFMHSKRQSHPIINIKLFKIRTFQISILGNLCARLGFGGIPFLLPLLLQIGIGYSAQFSGLLIAPIALGVLLTKAISLRVVRLLGYKKLLILNCLFVALSLWTFCIITEKTSAIVIAVLTFIFGSLISLQYSGMNSLAYANLETEDLSAATSIMSTTQQMSQSFGVATSALLLQYFSVASNNELKLIPLTFHQVFFALGFLTLFSTVIFIRLKRNDGAQMLSSSSPNSQS